MTIFCQSCYDSTHDVTKSVHSANTNGSCSKCGSEAVLDAALMAAVMAPKAIAKAIAEEVTPRQPRRIQSNTDFIRQEDIREFLKAYKYDEIEKWWDGTYFEHHLWFLVAPGYSGSDFEIMIENRDGSQKQARFRVAVEVLND